MGLGATRRTVLVTGAAGFIGSHLVDRLLAEGFEVVGIDNLMTGDLGNLDAASKDRHFHLEIGDVRRPINVYAELVFNLACPASPVHYQHDPYATLTTSFLGAMNLVDIARDRSCRIVHASTSEIYGSPRVHPQTEDYWGNVNPVGPRACYDEGKRAAETLFADAKRMWGVDARIVRIFNTYGPRMAEGDGRVVSNFIRQSLIKQNITVYGDGTQTRSFCYVDDLVEGLVQVSRIDDLNSPMNLGNPNEFTILDLAREVLAVTENPNAEIVFEPLPQDDPLQRKPDISMAQEMLGFSPKISLKMGISATAEYFAQRMKPES